MGTRADFYVGKGEKAKWLGSIAWDGYPDGLSKNLLKCKTEKTFCNQVTKFLEKRDDATFPKEGWPWPWKDSRTTDYAYCFYDKKVWASCFGHEFFDPLIESTDEDDEHLIGEEKEIFPDMTAIQKVTMGKRSGIMVVSMKK